jgi:hypothetical protein
MKRSGSVQLRLFLHEPPHRSEQIFVDVTPPVDDEENQLLPVAISVQRFLIWRGMWQITIGVTRVGGP